MSMNSPRNLRDDEHDFSFAGRAFHSRESRFVIEFTPDLDLCCTISELQFTFPLVLYLELQGGNMARRHAAAVVRHSYLARSPTCTLRSAWMAELAMHDAGPS